MRRDYAFPFRIDAASGQAAQAPYAAHVDQMIRQILLTSPGERIDLPTFGCGIRRLLFAPNTIGSAAPTQIPAQQSPLTMPSDAFVASTQVLVQQALNQWLSNQIKLLNVDVQRSEDGSQLLITIQYQLIETRQTMTTEVTVL
jgi:phage baseplate assembly protein W